MCTLLFTMFIYICIYLHSIFQIKITIFNINWFILVSFLDFRHIYCYNTWVINGIHPYISLHYNLFCYKYQISVAINSTQSCCPIFLSFDQASDNSLENNMTDFDKLGTFYNGMNNFSTYINLRAIIFNNDYPLLADFRWKWKRKNIPFQQVSYHFIPLAISNPIVQIPNCV